MAKDYTEPLREWAQAIYIIIFKPQRQ